MNLALVIFFQWILFVILFFAFAVVPFGATDPRGTTPQVHEDHMARLGKRMVGVKTGQLDGNLAGDSGTATRLRFVEDHAHFI